MGDAYYKADEKSSFLFKSDDSILLNRHATLFSGVTPPNMKIESSGSKPIFVLKWKDLQSSGNSSSASFARGCQSLKNCLINSIMY